MLAKFAEDLILMTIVSIIETIPALVMLTLTIWLIVGVILIR